MKNDREHHDGSVGQKLGAKETVGPGKHGNDGGRDGQDKEDLRPRITTKGTDETANVPEVTGDETHKPITGTTGERTDRETRPTRDDGDNDDQGSLK